LEEFYIFARHLNFTREDLLNMPIFERKFYISKLSQEFEQKQEALDKAKNKMRR